MYLNHKINYNNGDKLNASAWNNLASDVNELGQTVENVSNKVAVLIPESTNTQYPSAKAVYDFVKDSYSFVDELVGNKSATTGTIGDDPYNGMGRIYLPKNMANNVNTLTQDMFYKGPTESRVPNTDTIFVIQYDYDLGDESITIPDNCILDFDGGSVSNGTLVGNNTIIEAGLKKIFGEEVTLDGTWNVKEGYPEWFGCVPDDNTIDTTPAIQKFVAVAIPVVFGDGTWYLSECLLQGEKNVNIKGTGSHYRIGTSFKAFNATGQRFILKLGGLSDFSVPSDYYASWCSHFILDGIDFNTWDTTFVNADLTGTCQNYAAVCFEFCVNGYINIRTRGNCPGVFIASSWELYFESITCYGSVTTLNESAIYFGKAANIAASNITAVTINNLFGEAINGKFIDSHSGAIMGDVIIKNIEFEPQNGLDHTIPSHRGSDAASIIENNIRNMNILYYFNFSGTATIYSITYEAHPETYENDTIARGLIKATTGASHLIVENISAIASDCGIILGSFGTGNARLVVGNIDCSTYSGVSCVYTDTGVITDFTNMASGLYTSYLYTGEIVIEKCNTIIDKDIIKVYNSGIVFDGKSAGEVTALMSQNDKATPIIGKLNGVNYSMLYFMGFTLGRKFKFNGQKLVLKYTAPNKYDTANVIFTYYKNGNIVNTDNIKLPYSDTELLSFEYLIYSEDYDYCTIRFKSAICIESVCLYSVENEETDNVIMFPSKISENVKTIMSHYVRDDIYKRAALQYFFDKIGSVKDKLNHLILPIFSNNLDEALYDVINDAPFYNVDGGNYLEFNKPTRRLHMSVPVDGDITWREVSYNMYDPNDFQGCLTVMSTTDPIGGASADFKGVMLYGINTRLNYSAAGFFAPSTTDNVKIIGGGIVNADGVRSYMRLGDTPSSDRLYATGDTLYMDWDYRCQIFGQKPDDNTKGVRILVSTDQLLTDEEAKLLRDAVIALDNKYSELDAVNENYTAAMEADIIPKSGTFTNRPTIANYVIPVGFSYFCTDKQTTEGATDGIQIFYKGQDTTDPDNPVDVWVDALGRNISNNN